MEDNNNFDFNNEEKEPIDLDEDLNNDKSE